MAVKQYVKQHRVLFFAFVSVLVLLLASPTLQRILVLPQTEFFTELWLLGPQHTAENYPFNISRNENYSVVLGIGNHLGHSAKYIVEVKLRNETQPAASSFTFTASSLPSLYNITSSLADKETWELPVHFSFDHTNYANLSQVDFNHVIFNGVTLDLGEYSAAWDQQKSGFFVDLFFELWIYNSTIGSFQYHNRFVSLRLNMTAT